MKASRVWGEQSFDKAKFFKVEAGKSPSHGGANLFCFHI